MRNTQDWKAPPVRHVEGVRRRKLASGLKMVAPHKGLGGHSGGNRTGHLTSTSTTLHRHHFHDYLCKWFWLTPKCYDAESTFQNCDRLHFIHHWDLDNQGSKNVKFSTCVVHVWLQRNATSAATYSCYWFFAWYEPNSAKRFFEEGDRQSANSLEKEIIWNEILLFYFCVISRKVFSLYSSVFFFCVCYWLLLDTFLASNWSGLKKHLHSLDVGVLRNKASQQPQANGIKLNQAQYCTKRKITRPELKNSLRGYVLMDGLKLLFWLYVLDSYGVSIYL